MARHRGDDQQRRSGFRIDLAEAFELPERLPHDHVLVDRDRGLPDARFENPELGLSARLGGMGEHLEARRDHGPHRAVAPRVGRVAEPSGAQSCKLARTCEKRTLHFIGVVKHRTSNSVSGKPPM